MDGILERMDSMNDPDLQGDADARRESIEPDDASDESTADTGRPADDPPVEIHPRRVVEAILMAADSPLSAAKIAAILDVGDARDVKSHIEALNREYDQLQLSFRIEHLAGGYQILTLPAYNTWLAKLLRARQETKLSSAAMETLAIVAYKQPCTRADVEAIRGVAAGDLLNRLREINLIKIVGRAEDLGRPLLYGTTKHFLEVFGLPSLDDLPQVGAFRSAVAAGPSTQQRSERAAAPDSPESAVEQREPADADAAEAQDRATAEEGDVEADTDLEGSADEASGPPRLSIVRDENETTAQ